MVARAKEPAEENTFHLKRFALYGAHRPVSVCVGVGGCGALVGDSASHILWHTRQEDESVALMNRITALEQQLERLQEIRNYGEEAISH